MIWFRRSQGLDSGTMRQIANDAGVGWDYHTIDYRGRGIAYADGDSADVTAIQEAAKELLGYRPVQIEEPDKLDRDE